MSTTLCLISVWLYGTELAAGKLQCRDVDGWAYSMEAELAERLRHPTAQFVALSVHASPNRWRVILPASICLWCRSTASSHRPSCVAAVGIDDRGGKHPPALIAGATENAACGAGAGRQSLIARGFDAALLPLFIIDGSKVLTGAIRRTATCRSSAVSFARHTNGRQSHCTPLCAAQVRQV